MRRWVPGAGCQVLGAAAQICAHRTLAECWWGWPVGSSDLFFFPFPHSTSTTRLPPKPGAGCGTNVRLCAGGGAGQHPQPSGFYTCTAEYLMPGAAPQGAAPSFIFFFNQRKDKRRAEAGSWWCAAVCLLRARAGGPLRPLVMPAALRGRVLLWDTSARWVARGPQCCLCLPGSGWCHSPGTAVAGLGLCLPSAPATPGMWLWWQFSKT